MFDKALTKQAASLFSQFHNFKNFYLVGGTALALQIGHRLSVDFVFFSEKNLSPSLLSKTKRVFKNSSIILTYRSQDQLNILIDNVKTTFFYFEYPVLKAFINYQNIAIANILEIASMKAFSIGKRLSYKDYVDWYFLLNEKHVVLKEVIEHAKKKFGGDFNDRLFLGQLVSLENIPLQKISFIREAIDRKTIQDYLKTVVENYQI